ncbi:MAG: hypothetical protein A2W00_05850 [Candidatus Eisenbacteria bacterium RBG_16_71_46]|nr:MAG: hypothetical protein A2W00_05850 [Candidatus Eisenbacteria bacterium RBG_16_71_46]
MHPAHPPNVTPHGRKTAVAPRRSDARAAEVTASAGGRWVAASLLGLLVALAAVAAAAQPTAKPYTAFYGRDLSVPFMMIGGVAVDSLHGEILVSDNGRHEVAAFDTNGVLLGMFLHEVPGPDGALIDGMPSQLAIDRRGRILLSDQRVSWVDVLDVRGRPVARLDLPAPDDDPLKSGAGALAVRPDGTILVATRGDSGRVYVFDRDYRRIGAWGVPGADSGQLSAITGIAVTPDLRTVVTCLKTRYAVQIFDPAGACLQGFGVHDHGPGNFSFPSGVTVTADGRIWVSDGLRQVVQVFDSAGTLVEMVGGAGNGPGEFLNPCALASDGRELLAVAERVGNRIQVMRAR